MVNKVRIEIAGSRYVIATPEGEERVLSLGREIGVVSETFAFTNVG